MTACSKLGNSAEGRFIVQCELNTTRSIEHRSCFAKLVDFAMNSLPELSYRAWEALTANCRLGDDTAASCLLKMRVLEGIEQQCVDADRRGHVPPTMLIRFLASISLCESVQVAIARRSELMTILLETAAAGSSTVSTLALMTLRNIALNSATKSQLPQDAKILQLLKECLWKLPTASSPVKRSVEKEDYSIESRLNVYRRQQLAGTAIWAIAHNNQRAKGYLRGALRSKPVCTIDDLATQVSAVEKLIMLPEYRTSMDNIIDALRQLHVSS